MHLSAQEVPVQNLLLGMFVSRLDVPWVQTPFPIQGFHIERQEQLEQLSLYCNKVFVDRFLSKIDISSDLDLTTIKPSGTKDFDFKTKQLMSEKARFKPSVENHTISRPLKKEVKQASQLYNQISGQMAAIFRSMMQNGFVNITEVRSASTAMVKSVLRNPDALAWLCRINADNKALHEQAVRSAIWGIIFARHLGLSKHDLRDISTSLLLAPIGKSQLPKELLLEELTAEKKVMYEEHLTLTLDETQKMFSSSHQVNYILASYCERNNGTGYPRKLVGNRIPFLARVAGIAHHYEELINPLIAENALTPVEAISHIYNERGNLFQKELVESFIQAIGLYPTGSLIQLNNQSVGVVMEQPEKSRLKPKVVIVKNAHNVTLKRPKIISLANNPVDQYGTPLHIQKSLRSTSVDIDTKTLHEKLFVKTSWFSFLQAS
jgi:HD-GYP domain-containing protein (c-di-GMP phosphodiesterase class II)